MNWINRENALNREFILYDALYAECNERSASHETK
jgi:hypothetical protein